MGKLCSRPTKKSDTTLEPPVGKSEVKNEPPVSDPESGSSSSEDNKEAKVYEVNSDGSFHFLKFD